MNQSASTVIETSLAALDDVQLPHGWRWMRVGDISNLVNGDAYKPHEWSTSGVPIIRIQNLNDESKPFNHWSGSLHNRVRVKAGDILLAWSGTPGTSFGTHLWQRCDGVLNQHIFRVDLKDGNVLPTWFVYATNHRLHILIDKAHGGVGLRHVTKGEVEKLEIPLPPINEQKRLAAALTEQMAAVERARAAAEEQLKAAKDLPAAYLRAVFEGEDAQQWSRKQLNELGELLPAKSIATEGDTQVIAITTACLSESGFQPSGVKTARMWASDAEIGKVSYGEILVARSNTPELVGRAAMFLGEPENAVASDLTIRFLPYSLDLAPFLAAYLSFLYITGYWKERAGGASGSMKKITRPQVLQLSVPVPSAEEQSKVVRAFSEQRQSIKQLMSALTNQLNDIKQLPGAFLRQAFTGKL